MENYNESLGNAEICVNTNMAMRQFEYILQKMLPEEFRRGDDVETFIEECERYFDFAKIPENKWVIAVEYFLEKDLRPLYRKVDPKIKDYKERLRTTFRRKTSMADDVNTAFRYRQTDEDPERYFQKIEKMVEMIMSHKWTKENLMEQLLVHCSNESSLKREICLNETKGIEGIKGKIERLYESRTVEEVNSMRNRNNESVFKKSYRDVVKPGGENRRPIRDYQVRKEVADSPRYNKIVCWTCDREGHTKSECPQKRRIECYGCGKVGHMKRECPEKRQIKCYGCGELGHRRSECQRISCARCRLGGHKESDCYTNLNGPRFKSGYGVERQVKGNNYYKNDRETAGKQRENKGYVAYVGEEMNIRRNEDRYDQTREEEYPNDQASIMGDIIGAMQ